MRDGNSRIDSGDYTKVYGARFQRAVPYGQFQVDRSAVLHPRENVQESYRTGNHSRERHAKVFNQALLNTSESSDNFFSQVFKNNSKMGSLKAFLDE
jgi:hypothetical protein